MKKLTIGLPRAFLYYRYHIFWETFFTKLNCQVQISEKTTKEIINLGKKYSIDESCLSSKIYLGHVASLKDKCDYILIPRVENYGSKEKVCVKFNATYDLIHNLFPNYQLLDYNIEKDKFTSEFLSFFKIGLKLHKNPFRIIISYLSAKKAEKQQNRYEEQQQQSSLSTPNPKILLISHPYNTYDNYVGIPIIKKLESMGLTIIYADKLNRKIAKQHSPKLSPTLYWTYSKELIGAISYYHSSVDGIIFLTTFPCGPDSLVNELMIRKITTIPITNILIDELTSSVGLDTRLESFVDILKERRNQK